MPAKNTRQRRRPQARCTQEETAEYRAVNEAKLARVVEAFAPKGKIEPSARRLILERMPQIRAFWLQAHDRPTSTLTTTEIYQALDALPEPDPDRQSRRGYKATADYYRAQRPKRSGRRKGGHHGHSWPLLIKHDSSIHFLKRPFDYRLR